MAPKFCKIILNFACTHFLDELRCLVILRLFVSRSKTRLIKEEERVHQGGDCLLELPVELWLVVSWDSEWDTPSAVSGTTLIAATLTLAGVILEDATEGIVVK